MLHSRANPKRMFAVVLFSVAVVMVVASCVVSPFAPASPDPLPTSLQSAPGPEEIWVYPLNADVSYANQVDNIAAILRSVSREGRQSIGNSEDLRDELTQGTPISQMNAFIRPENLSWSDEVLSVVLSELLIENSSLICVAEYGQSSLLVNGPAAIEFIGENVNEPDFADVAEVVNSCGDISCEGCTCVGPMQDPPHCTSSAIQWAEPTRLLK